MDELDDFVAVYSLLAIASAVGFVLFWGVVIFLVIRFFRSNNGMTRQQKIDLITTVAQAANRSSPYREPGPNETAARDALINAGIDPNR